MATAGFESSYERLLTDIAEEVELLRQHTEEHWAAWLETAGERAMLETCGSAGWGRTFPVIL